METFGAISKFLGKLKREGCWCPLREEDWMLVAGCWLLVACLKSLRSLWFSDFKGGVLEP